MNIPYIVKAIVIMEHNDVQLISSILNDMSDGVILIGFDGKILLHNHAAAQLLSIPEESLTGKSIAWIMNQTDANDAFFEIITDAVYSKRRTVKTIPYVNNGSMTYLYMTSDFLMHGEEKAGVIAHISDVTDATTLYLRNRSLANQIRNLMKSFVEVMVTAVEEKSSYNANHTKNMVSYAEKYIERMHELEPDSPCVPAQTEPFLMSVWLHDIGKLLIPQKLMDKPTRLGSKLNDIQHRIETGRLMLQIRLLKGEDDAEAYAEKLQALDDAEQLILSANTAGILEDETVGRLYEAAKTECIASDGTTCALLTPEEVEAITVVRGTLTEAERRIIESHVSLTAKLLSKMEFTGDYESVPEWAAGHHELLDGSGYPQKRQGDEIAPETRLLTIIDIYDALTADDRPYKPPMEPEKAFEILRSMAEGKKLDADILESFYRSGAWKRE